MKLLNKECRVLLFFLLFTVNLHAKVQIEFKYTYEYTRSFALILKNLDQQAYNIYLKDLNEVTLISESVHQQERFGRMYNLEQLPEGTYNVYIESDQKIIIQPIYVSQRFLNIDFQQQKEILKPAILFDDGVIAINMLHFEKTPVVFTLKNQKGTIVFSKQFTPFGSLNKRLKVSNLPSTQYQLEIETTNYTVIKQIDTKKDFNTLALTP